MKKRTNIWIHALAIIGLLFLVAVSCKKKEDINNDIPEIGIGKNYGGGIIFYIDNTGLHGLIATTSVMTI